MSPDGAVRERKREKKSSLIGQPAYGMDTSQTPQTRSPKLLWTKTEIAGDLAISPRTLTEWIQRKLIKGRPLGRGVSFNQDEVREFLNRSRVRSDGENVLVVDDRQRVFLTKKAVAKTFGVTTRTVTNWCQSRKIPYYKFGRTVRFCAEEIIEARLLKAVMPLLAASEERATHKIGGADV